MQTGAVLCLALLCCHHALGFAAGSLSGTVTNLQTGAPLSEASVILHLNTADNLAATAPTDAQGRFAFHNLPRGTYTLEAQHSGFEGRWFGACAYDEEGAALELHPGEQRTGLFVRLPPLGVITGTLTGPAEEPLARVMVTVHPAQTPPGRRSSPRFYSLPGWTDAHGSFRIFGVRAGTYVVSAFSDETTYVLTVQPGQQAPTAMSYQPAYYPGTILRSEATVINLSMGELRENVDFQLPLIHPVGIEATVQAPSDFEPPLQFQAELNSAFTDSLISFSFSTDGSTTYPLRFDAVSPDRYGLQIAGSKNGRAFGSYQLIDITNNEGGQRSLAVQLEPASDVPGTITIEGATPARIQDCRVSLKRANGSALVEAIIGRDGGFVLPKVLPGAWTLDIQALPTGSYLKSVTYEGREVAQNNLVIETRAAGPLRIRIGARGGSFRGRFQRQRWQSSSRSCSGGGQTRHVSRRER